jgi:hypothetical protein
LVNVQAQLLCFGIVGGQAVGCEQLVETLRAPNTTLRATVPIKNAKVSTVVLKVDNVSILHASAPAVHFSNTNAKLRGGMALEDGALHWFR